MLFLKNNISFRGLCTVLRSEAGAADLYQQIWDKIRQQQQQQPPDQNPSDQQQQQQKLVEEYLRLRSSQSSHYANNAHLVENDDEEEEEEEHASSSRAATQPSNHLVYMDATSLYPSSGKNFFFTRNFKRQKYD